MNLERLLQFEIEPVEQTLTPRDCMLYALGLGFGADPTSPEELQYVFEKDLKVFPTMASVIADAGMWMTAPELEIDAVRLLHGEQRQQLHRPLQADTRYRGEFSVLGVSDKGEGRGALMYVEKKLTECSGNQLAATLFSVIFLRGDGGCGSTDFKPPASGALDGADAQSAAAAIPTLPQAALLYRLSGDYNPLHADPALAEKAGFPQPILHGLCGYGVAARGLLQACNEPDADRLKRFELRFSAPMLPGDTLETQVRREGGQASFQTRASERDVTVLKHGYAELA